MLRQGLVPHVNPPPPSAPSGYLDRLVRSRPRGQAPDSPIVSSGSPRLAPTSVHAAFLTSGSRFRRPRSGSPARRTLPPPEWQGRDGPRSAASLLLERSPWGEPSPAAAGRARSSRCCSPSSRPRTATGHSSAPPKQRSRALLATRGTQLDVATRLARRALLLGDDPQLREELAGWFVTLGEPALAAATLRPLVPAAGGPSDGAARAHGRAARARRRSACCKRCVRRCVLGGPDRPGAAPRFRRRSRLGRPRRSSHKQRPIPTSVRLRYAKRAREGRGIRGSDARVRDLPGSSAGGRAALGRAARARAQRGRRRNPA